MPRYILIDNGTGYIWADSADFRGRIWHSESGEDTPAEFAAAVDASLGAHGRTYESVANLDSNATGYFVYRVDVRGSDQLGNVHDGQSREEIEAVERDCDLVDVLLVTNPED